MIADTIPPAPPAQMQNVSPLAQMLAARGFRPVRLRTSIVGHFHVTGTIDGHAIEILIDTGAASTIIERSVAERLGLALTPLTATGGGVGNARMALASLPPVAFSIDGVSLPGVAPIAMDLTNVRTSLTSRGAAAPDLVLGVDVLKPWSAVIDYATSTLWLAPAPEAR